MPIVFELKYLRIFDLISFPSRVCGVNRWFLHHSTEYNKFVQIHFARLTRARCFARRRWCLSERPPKAWAGEHSSNTNSLFPHSRNGKCKAFHGARCGHHLTQDGSLPPSCFSQLLSSTMRRKTPRPRFGLVRKRTATNQSVQSWGQSQGPQQAY